MTALQQPQQAPIAGAAADSTCKTMMLGPAADLVIGLRQLAPSDRDIHGVSPAKLMLACSCVEAAQAGSSCVYHHLPACLPFSHLKTTVIGF